MNLPLVREIPVSAGVLIAGFAVVIFQVAVGPVDRYGDRPFDRCVRAWVVVALTGIGIGSVLYGVMRRTGEEHQRWLAGLKFAPALTMALE